MLELGQLFQIKHMFCVLKRNFSVKRFFLTHRKYILIEENDNVGLVTKSVLLILVELNIRYVVLRQHCECKNRFNCFKSKCTLCL